MFNPGDNVVCVDAGGFDGPFFLDVGVPLEKYEVYTVIDVTYEPEHSGGDWGSYSFGPSVGYNSIVLAGVENPLPWRSGFSVKRFVKAPDVSEALQLKQCGDMVR